MIVRQRGRAPGWSRREAMQLLGLGSVSLAVACRGGSVQDSTPPDVERWCDALWSVEDVGDVTPSLTGVSRQV